MFCQYTTTVTYYIIKEKTRGVKHMRYTEIAIANPFEGEPKINLPKLLGASKGKPVIVRVAVTGKRPIEITAENLPKGLTLNGNIITGSVKEDGDYTFTITAKNNLGEYKKNITLEVGENKLQPTPLMGFTSWNAYAADVSQEKMELSADRMVETGITEYGYNYINTDSGWQEAYGGKYDAIMPNVKFPDMKKMCDKIHSYGLKAGIYSTPMLNAWGCPKEFKSIPGCTTGEADELFAPVNTGIGKERKEANCVKQWDEWGFDYLKYDWKPCDPYNAELMRRELIKASRDFAFCVTVAAVPLYTNYWSKYVNNYRNNSDSTGRWDTTLDLFKSYEDFIPAMKKGHFFDLDMLDMGTCNLFKNGIEMNEDEQIAAFSLRAFMGSPIQISSTLENISEFELSLYCNDEIIEINQDTEFSPALPYLMIEDGKKKIQVYKRKLENGDIGLAVFNLGETSELVSIYLDEPYMLRDVWAKKDMSEVKTVVLRLYPHTARIIRGRKNN